MFMVERVSYSLIGVRLLRDVRTLEVVVEVVGAFTLFKGLEKLMKMTMIDVVFKVL
jgi:hypothetical protein